MKPRKYGDLPTDASKRGLVLYCDWCGSTFAADRGDYFMVRDETKAMCGFCEEGGLDNTLILSPGVSRSTSFRWKRCTHEDPMIAHFLCRLFGHARNFVECEEFSTFVASMASTSLSDVAVARPSSKSTKRRPKGEAMRVVYIPQSSPDDPEEFGLEYPGPLGTGNRFKHMERHEVEELRNSCIQALKQSDAGAAVRYAIAD